MEELPNNNPTQRPQFFSKETTPGVPPPPPEVKVRTMRSDLESMAKTGGGLPRFENVKVSGLSIERAQGTGAPAAKGNKILLVVIVIVVFVAITAVGYFAYTTFFASSSGPPSASNNVVPKSASTTPISSTSAQSTGQVVAASSPELSATHVSLFKKAPDQVIPAVFSPRGAIQSATDLQSYSQKMLGVLAAVNHSAAFLEVDAKFSDGHDISINGLFSEAGTPVIDPQVLAAHFNPDATFFVYRDKNGFWPGYVIALNQGENWLFLKNDVQKLESSSGLGGLFLGNIGTPSTTGFVDGTVASTTVRMISFSGPSSQAQFVYGWFQNYLILSTSQNGFAQAVARLQ